MIRHYTLTLTGSAQQLSAVLPDDFNNRPLSKVSIQPAAANSNPIFVGGAGVSATDYGVRLETPVASVPQAPWEHEYGFERTGPRLSDFYVIGTNTEKLHILAQFRV